MRKENKRLRRLIARLGKAMRTFEKAEAVVVKVKHALVKEMWDPTMMPKKRRKSRVGRRAKKAE